MAETVARRGGLVVIPQDIPIPVVADVVAWVKQRHLVFDTPIELAPHQTVAEALSLMPKRAHRARWSSRTAGRSGVVTAADCAEVDRFAQVQHVMRPAEVTVSADTRPARGLRRARRRARAGVAVGVDADGRLVGVLTRTGALRATLYDPAVDAGGGLRVAAAVGVNGDVARQGGPAARGRRRLPGRRHRARPPGPDGRGAGRVRALRPDGAGRGRQRGLRRRAPAPWSRPAPTSSRSASGPGAMCTTRMMTGVGRPQFSAVLECAAGRRASSASTSGPTAACGTRATSRWPWPPVPRR